MGHAIQILYFVRIPLLTLAALAGFGWAATGPARSLLGALLDFEGDWMGLVSLAMAAGLVSAAALTTLNLTLLYGPERFDLGFQPDPGKHGWLKFAGGVLPAVYLFVCACRITQQEASEPWPVMRYVAAGACGFALAGLLVVAAKYLQCLLSIASGGSPPPSLVFPISRVPWLDRRFASAYRRTPDSWVRLRKRLSGWAQPVFEVLAVSGEGYFVPNRRPLTLLPGQVFAIWLAALSLGVYLGIGIGKQAYIGQRGGFSIPSLTYVLFALMAACWLFAGLAFFLDRFRIPVLIAFLALTSLTRFAPESDHFYRVARRETPIALPSPAEVLARFGPDRVPVLVAAAGGGIQAAAWTTTVLAGLEDDCQNRRPACSFREQVAMLGGVSGGSVGIMHFGAHFDDLATARRLSRESSLDDVAWGWINPDVWRAILPWFRNPVIDRGWALERSFEEMRDSKGNRVLAEAWLSDWAARTGQGFPAFLFNATAVERGSPLVLASSGYHPRESEGIGVAQSQSFADLYPNTDLRITTAARLSATFPYVSPASRPNLGSFYCPDFHLVDGGYYDNYGLLTMMDWLDAALRDAPVKPRRIVILRILPFPDSPLAKGTVQAWGYQAGAPLEAFLSVRSTAQFEESLIQLRLFEEYWQKTSGIEIEDIAVQFPKEGVPVSCQAPPLSWKLTGKQQQCLDTAWNGSPQIERTAKRILDRITGAQP